MRKEDIEFLQALKNEMLTQDTVGQADPRFWVIMQQEQETWVSDNTDGIFIYDCCNENVLFEGDYLSDEFKKWFIEFVEDRTKEIIEIEEINFDLHFTFNNSCFCIFDIKDLEIFINENCNTEVSIGYYRLKNVIKEDTLFLTKREAEEHLKRNSYHYNDTAHPFAMTAWRSPQVERLYKILQNTEWEKELKEK